jgi:hypothetical protein
MALDTLQQRIHRARTEIVMDALYDEAEQFYVDEDIPYNFACALCRELNRQFFNAFRTETAHYEFFDGVVGGGSETFDSDTLLFDSTLKTFDQA